MSNKAGGIGLFSEQEVIDWLKVRPRTFGWDAMILYDRLRANLLLLQEYIDRYSGDTHFDPITAKVAIVDGSHWEYLYNHVLDAPRLSFQNSTLADSIATLTMQILGGTQLTVEQMPNSPKRITKVELNDPLQGPKLIAEVRLAEADGSVIDNKVQLDLSKGLDFRLTFATTQQAQRKGGEFYKELFDRWPAPKKKFLLNELVNYGDHELLSPDQVRMRVCPAPGSNVRGSNTYGDGAVMVLVSSQGSEVGSLPDKNADWTYPIPEGHSCTLLIGNHYLMKKMIAKGIRRFSPDAVVDVVGGTDPAAPIGGAKAVSGSMDAGGYWLNFHGNFSLVFVEAVVPLADSDKYGSAAFTMKYDDYLGESVLGVEWNASSAPGSYATRLYQQAPEGNESTVDLEWALRSKYRPAINPDGSFGFEAIPYTLGYECKLLPRGKLSPVHTEYWEFLCSGLEPAGREKMAEANASIFFEFMAVNLFSLHGLLFRSGNAVAHRQAHLPADLALFGDVSPTRTAFSVQPLEHLMGAGESLQFTTSPTQPALTWKVEPVAGFDGDVGSITSSGTYSSPSSSKFGGSYTMVRVTASSADHVSSSLIRVVTRSVAVNPLVAVTSLSGGKIKMSAGTIDGGSLQWSLRTASGATLVDAPPEGGADFEEGDRFYVPGASPTGEAFSVDEVTAKNPRTGSSHTSYLLVVEKLLNGILRIKEGTSLPANKMQLELDAGEGPLSDVTFAVVAGGGSVDEKGIYTVDEASSHKFGVVTASWRMAGVPFSFDGYMIVPLPLVNLEEIRRALA